MKFLSLVLSLVILSGAVSSYAQTDDGNLVSEVVANTDWEEHLENMGEAGPDTPLDINQYAVLEKLLKSAMLAYYNVYFLSLQAGQVIKPEEGDDNSALTAAGEIAGVVIPVVGELSILRRLITKTFSGFLGAIPDGFRSTVDDYKDFRQKLDASAPEDLDQRKALRQLLRRLRVGFAHTIESVKFPFKVVWGSVRNLGGPILRGSLYVGAFTVIVNGQRGYFISKENYDQIMEEINKKRSTLRAEISALR